MNVLVDERIEKAYFISPIVNMQKLILNMMAWAGVTERELRNKKEIQTNFGEMLSWKYLCYVRENPDYLDCTYAYFVRMKMII